MPLYRQFLGSLRCFLEWQGVLANTGVGERAGRHDGQGPAPLQAQPVRTAQPGRAAPVVPGSAWHRGCLTSAVTPSSGNTAEDTHILEHTRG